MHHDLISPDLIQSIRHHYRLPWRGIHGVDHWARVLENGLRLAADTGAHPDVVSLFAVFHDSQRENEDHDPQHGLRGAELAGSLRKTLFTLPDDDFERLWFACAHHTVGRAHDDVTIQTCWDADRLDLGRVGIRPKRRYLCTDAARQAETIEWAYERSVRRHVPPFIATHWDMERR